MDIAMPLREKRLLKKAYKMIITNTLNLKSLIPKYLKQQEYNKFLTSGV